MPITVPSWPSSVLTPMPSFTLPSPKFSARGMSLGDSTIEASRALKELELWHARDTPSDMLSGGMKLNETKKIAIKAADAYGEKQDELIVDIPAENFGEGNVKEGMGVRTEDGHEGTVIGIGEKTIKVDFNPQLSGKDLNFEIKVAKIKKHA